MTAFYPLLDYGLILRLPARYNPAHAPASCPPSAAFSGCSPEPNPQRSGKIIRRENCSWHYFWKAGYCKESRAGIHCVWGRDWKPCPGEAPNACGNGALRGPGRGVSNNGRSQGYSWVTNSYCSRLTRTLSGTHSCLLCLSQYVSPSVYCSYYEFREMLSSHCSKLSSLAAWTCSSGCSGKLSVCRLSVKMNKCFVPHRPGLKQWQAARRDRWGINLYFSAGCAEEAQ